MWKLYLHKKGAPYLGYFTAKHSEDLSEDFMVYRCLYPNEAGLTWVRPKTMFEENRNGVKRFEEIATLELASPEDMNTVLMFGYDAWGDNKPPSDFVKSYEKCPNHLSGTRYVLRNVKGQLISGLNILRFSKELSGIASVATSPDYRKQGYAELLLKAVLALHEDQKISQRQILFSEISTAYYEKLGFLVLPQNQQKFSSATAMLRGAQHLSPDDLPFVEEYF